MGGSQELRRRWKDGGKERTCGVGEKVEGKDGRV